MNTKANFLCSCLMLSLIIMAQAPIRAESPVRLYDKSMKLLDQIKDLDVMQSNIEECYQAEKRTPIACWSGQRGIDHTEFDGRLMNRVLGHLAGTPEYERFMMAYQELIQRPGDRRIHTDELFAAYMRLLESGQIRFLTQLKDWQENLPEKSSTQAQGGLSQSIPVKQVTLGHAEGTHKTESERLAPALLLHVQMPVNSSTPLAVGRNSVLIIVIPCTDQAGSASTAAPTIDMLELRIVVAQERVVPQEKIPMGCRHGFAQPVRSGTLKNLEFSEGLEKGMGAWDQ